MVRVKPSDTRALTFVLAGGGTGGHLYPALAIADALKQRLPGAGFTFFVTNRTIDKLIIGSGDHEVVRQTLPPLRHAPWHWPGILSGLSRSSVLCRSHLMSSRILAVLGTGGLASVPGVYEARRAGIPTVLLNPDALPGKANRLLATAADLVCVQWEDTVERFSRRANVVVTGCAVRSQFNAVSRASGISEFGLDPDLRTLLVTGASQGARTINQAVIANLAFIENHRDWQVLHLAGEVDFKEVRRAYEGTSIRARVLPFTKSMAHALGAADLVVARAGASTLAEITAVGRPAILMPYPFHKDMHQLANARCLARVSAARIVGDAVDPAVNGPALRRVLEPLMTDGKARAAMAAAARRIGRGTAAEEIAARVLALASDRGMLSGRESMERL